jgi:hypothetical protein
MDKLSKSSREIYDRAINFLTSDYAKLLGKNAIISILSLMLIGGLASTGLYTTENIQSEIDKNMPIQNKLSQLADTSFSMQSDKRPTKKRVAKHVEEISELLISILSKLGGIESRDFSNLRQSSRKTIGTGLKGKGFLDDFKAMSKKVYKELTSDEAKLIGKTALTTIILAAMGYSAHKAFNGKPSQYSSKEYENAIKSGDYTKASDIINKSFVEGDQFPTSNIKTLKDLNDAQFAKQAAEFVANKKKAINKPTLYDPYSYPDDPQTPQTTASGLKGGKWTTKDIKDYIHKVVTSKEAKGLGIAALTSLIIAGLGIAGYKAHQYTRDRLNPDVTDSDFIKSQRNNAKLKAKEKDIIPIKRSTQFIDMLEEEDPQHNLSVPLSKLKLSKRVVLGDLGTYNLDNPEGIKRYIAEHPELITYDLSKGNLEREEDVREIVDDIIDNIGSNNMTKPVAKKMASDLVDSIMSKKIINPIQMNISMSGNKQYKAPEFNDYYSKEVVIPPNKKAEVVKEDKQEAREAWDRIKAAKREDYKEWERAREESQKGILRHELDKMTTDQRTEYFKTHKLPPDELKSIYGMHQKEYEAIQKNLESGKGMKGKGFSDDAKKIKDKIYKAITSQKAKTISATVLSTLILTALGAMGYHKIKNYEDKLRSIEENALSNSRDRNFIKKMESEWETEYKPEEEKTPATHFTGEGLKKYTDKELKIASKKIADLIQYARDLYLDKAALFSLITFLLGSAGYGGFRYIKGKARASEPIGYIPEDDVRAALEEYATGKHRMAENIRADTRNANLPWGAFGFGLNKKLKGGDLSKFGDYAKKKEEAEKVAKPIAKKITDLITSDEAKLIGKAAIQYSILTALAILTGYAGKKVAEKAIKLYPEDKSKINDPEAIMQSFGENAPTGDTEAVQAAMRQKATTAALRKAFKPDPTIKKPDDRSFIRPPEGRIVSSEVLNLNRYLLENPTKQGVVQYLKDMGYSQPYSEAILRDDPALATIFNEKMHSKAPLEAVNRYKPPTTGTYRNPSDISETGAMELSHLDVYKNIKKLLHPTKIEESKEEFKSIMQQVAPTISVSSMEDALKAQEELEKNRPNFTVKQDKPSYIVPPKKSVKNIAKQFSGTSAPTPESEKVVKSPPVKAPVEKSNPYLDAMIKPISVKKDEDDSGKGLKEDFTKKINQAGDGIYKVITSPQVQGIAGGVTAGLIVSVLSMLMHEKRQAVLAARKINKFRPPSERILGDLGDSF